MPTQEEIREAFIKEHGDSLYHYTSMHTLFKMLNDKEIWLSNALTTNDKSELQNLIRLLQEAFRDTPYENQMLRLANRYNEFMGFDNTFFMCFSKKRDDAAQWERYACNSDGVCIIFDTYELLNINNKTLPLFAVKYERDIRNSELFNELQITFSKKLPEYEMIDRLLNAAKIYKHSSFDSEAEIRLIAEASDFYGVDTVKPKYECVNNQIKNILAIHPFNFDKLIKGIIIGPKSKQNIKILKSYISSKKLTALAENITFSDCPLR